MIKSDIPCTHKKSILSIMLKACLNVVFLSIILKILSFGMMISVSTASFNFFTHSSAFFLLIFPSKPNGSVTTHTVSIPICIAISPTTGAAPVPVPHPIHHVMNTISVSCSIALMSSMFSSAALRPISGSAPAHKPLVRLSQMFIFDGAGFSAKS
jgi:hypothetical protein